MSLHRVTHVRAILPPLSHQCTTYTIPPRLITPTHRRPIIIISLTKLTNLSHTTVSYGQPETSESPPEEADLQPTNPLPLIIRATNGKSKEKRAAKVKLSTIVQPDELDAFYGRYAEVCKGGMTALKPRDRTKRKAKARKKKTTTATTPTA